MSEETKGFKIDASSLRAYTMIGALVLIWAYFHWATGGTFLRPNNISNLMQQMAVTGILAVGMLMVIVSGNIDLSIGSVLGLAGGVCAIFMSKLEYPMIVAILAAVVIGILIGAFQGFLTTYLKIPAFIVTLGGLLAWRGAVKWVTNLETITVSDPTFKMIGSEYILPPVGWAIAGVAVLFLLFSAFNRARSTQAYGLGQANYGAEIAKAIIPIVAAVGFVFYMNSYKGIPISVLILLIVALVGAFITNRTTFGRYLYAIGGNADAARLSGINDRFNVLKVYALLGLLIGVASVIFLSRLGSATPDAGVLKELDAIAACVIGGASLVGGRGTIFGACLGALIMASLDNGMGLLGWKDYVQEIVKGGILVTAVGLDMWGRKSS